MPRPGLFQAAFTERLIANKRGLKKHSALCPLMASSAQLQSLPTLYHQCLRSQELAKAEDLARLAQQTPTYQGEAHLWQGLAQFQAGQYSTAFVHIAKALEHQPAEPTLYILLVRCLEQQGLWTQACSVLEIALTLFPTNRNLRHAQVPLWLGMHCANLLSKAALQQRLQAGIPDTVDPQELRQVLDAMHSAVFQPNAEASEASAPEKTREATINSCVTGVVWHNPVHQQISGWIIDLNDHTRQLEVEVEFAHQGRTVRTRFLAKTSSPLLQASYGISHGGFLAQLPVAVEALTVRCADGPALLGSPLAALPVFSPPAKAAQTHTSKTQAKHPVDILVPVYKGREATLECVDSVIRHASRNRTRYNLIVLDDASPDTELVAALQKRARQGKLRYLRHPANLGFIRNMNRGMALHPEHDVVWLNADTRVHGDWLDRLRSAAYSAEDIASVTPWSNNGELMSFPRMCHAAPMPTAQVHAALDDATRRLDLAPVSLETGCGFCMYIKRQALDEVGYLDEVHLKRGYGEETDWCLRAQSRNWRHVGAVNVFVAHAGGHSFGAEKALRVYQNNAVLRQRYPHADRNFKHYLATDPLAPARNRLIAALRKSAPQQQFPSQAAAPALLTQEWLERAEGHLLAPLVKSSSEEAVKAVHVPLQIANNGNTCVSFNSASTCDASFVLRAPLWLIADSLGPNAPAALAQRWIELARHLARWRYQQTGAQSQAPLLLLYEDTPWQTQLLATGQVVKCPDISALCPKDFFTACGNPEGLSLASDTASSWLATLPSLYAPADLPVCPATTS